MRSLLLTLVLAAGLWAPAAAQTPRASAPPPGTFLCADRPDRPLFAPDYDKCTHVLLSTLKTPDPRRPAVREVTLQVEAAVPGSRARYRLSEIRVRVTCPGLAVTALSAVNYDRSGRVLGRDAVPRPLPPLTAPRQVKAMRAACSATPR